MSAITLDAKVENLDRVLAFVDQALEDMSCSPKTQMQIDIAVEELFVNVAHYAYTPGEGPVTVCVEVEKDTGMVAITLTDRGVPYNPLAKADPDVTLSAVDRQVGGLGIFMVKKAMDAMQYEYRDGQNCLTIKKKL